MPHCERLPVVVVVMAANGTCDLGRDRGVLRLLWVARESESRVGDAGRETMTCAVWMVLVTCRGSCDGDEAEVETCLATASESVTSLVDGGRGRRKRVWASVHHGGMGRP